MSAALRRCLVSLLALALAGLLGPSAARAGTTGSLTGTVLDAKTRAPLAGVTVTATSPSQTGRARTDAGGTFAFIALAPDTYALTLSRSGYDTLTSSGLTVNADQTQSTSLALQPSLATIGRVQSRSALDVVKPGTTTDVYSVTPAVAQAAATLGGGGGLNNAYSAIAALPGVFVPPGQAGVNQSVFIRGGYYDQIGYQYDGVPVNRSFDNYPGHSAASLGQQELQVYTGGGAADASASGLAGFINQVTRTGTYPGFGNLSARLGTPTFYHDLSAEFGGATPSRSFSYYVGASGYDQDFRYFDQANGAGQIALFPNTGPSNRTTDLSFYPAVYPACNAHDFSEPTLTYSGGAATPAYDPGCFGVMNPAYGDISTIRGRETVGNFHVALPHRSGDGGHDDVQLLYTNSAQYRQYYSGVDDAGLTPAAYGILPSAGVPGDTFRAPHWPDYLTYPAGTAFLSPADLTPIPYLFPGSPSGRCANVDLAIPGACPGDDPALLPPDYRDARWDTASILKLQYQKNLGSSAYVRLFGYSFYSDTNRSGASRRGIGSGFGVVNYDYEVDSHTRGGELQFGDQINDKNQLTGSLSYVTATTNRINNFNYDNTADTAVSNLTDGRQCFAGAAGTAANGVDQFGAGDPAPCNDPITQGTFGAPTQGQPVNGSALCAAGPSPACSARAAWRLTYTGNQGALNGVTPKFAAAALSDGWHPTDKLNLSLGMRFERDEYDLADTNTPGKNFWFAAAQREYCYNPLTLQPVFVPQPPQNASLQIPYVSFSCPLDASSGTPVQTVHPDGQNGHLLLSNLYDPRLVQNYFLPRFGATYTVDPNTVLRFSAGRYAQQPQAYEVQYNSLEENLANQLIGFLPYGFTTPRHDALPQYSDNYDLSYEHRFRGSDVSVKLTPYFRYATNQLYTVSVYGQSPALNSGIERSQGLELQLVKGDFRRNGLSGLLSYTYLDSRERWANFPGTNRNPVDLFNDEIAQYNALTRAGGGAPCYASSADATPDPACGPSSIANPYYAAAPQPRFDRNAWYQTGLDAPYLSPNVFALVLNYRRDKLAITPALSLNEGTWYGSPSDVIGLDPRTCSQNQGTSGFTTGNPQNADYTSCASAATPSGNLYVPNPETGRFDGFGAFRQPWQLNLGLQVGYDLNPRLRLSLSATNLLNRCFGGSATPWSRAFAPSSTVCGYQANPFYVNNFANGSGPTDAAANGVPLNPYFAHSFVPSYADTTSFGYAQPLQIFARLEVRL